MSTNDANNTPKPRLVLDDPTSSQPFEIGMTFSEQHARIKKYSELLDTLGKGLLHTGLVFTCQIGDLPKSTFQVTQFDLNEGLTVAVRELNCQIMSFLFPVRRNGDRLFII
ncbi:hypothetical protein ACBQ20_06205 [Proteus vulgaris]|uniref:hypothetical protein n=1 Tax=Proteus TaxID=583 RepID=UPI0032DAACBD